MKILKLVIPILVSLLPLITLACPITQADKMQGGRCINMGGYQMYMRAFGEKNPTIIFDSGSGDDSTTWNKVTPQVAKFARVVVYDRVGLGKSQPNPKRLPVSSQTVVNDLQTLLKKAQIKPPYILVGHSRGGLNMQLFAEEYPKEIVGMVLLDSVSRNQTFHDAPPPKTSNYYLEAITVDQSEAQVKQARPFPDIPLIVLTATCHHEAKSHEILWQKWQKQLAQLSPRGQQMIVYGSTHYIQENQPSVVVDAIATIMSELGKLNVPACQKN